mmetsp:Transcript_27136/g.46780  ORF Transcript_27136/g.46780 Transcript_27136/m.46780 type:complete len:319 (-) Transcript_27136:276-1232(-)
MADHDTVPGGLGHLAGIDAFENRADLVHLEQQGIAGLLLDGCLDALGVCDKKVVTDNLSLLADLGSELDVRVPIILVEGIFDGNNWEIGNEGLVQFNHLRLSLLKRLIAGGALEVQVVFLEVLLPELGGSNIHTDLDLAVISSLLDGRDDELESFTVAQDVGCEATLVTNIGSILAILVLDDRFQVVIDLSSHAHGLLERGGADREDHELLHGQLVASVRAAVDDVECWDGENEFVSRLASELSDVLVKGQAHLSSTSTTHSQRDAKNSISTILLLGLSSIELEHEPVDLELLGGVQANKLGPQLLIHILDGGQDTFA